MGTGRGGSPAHGLAFTLRSQPETSNRFLEINYINLRALRTGAFLTNHARVLRGMVTTLPPLAGNYQGPVPALDAYGLDVGAGGFGDAQPVEREQGDQCILGGRSRAQWDAREAAWPSNHRLRGHAIFAIADIGA